MTLGEGLRKIRKGNKYTLTDVSKLADISVPHLSTMECDKVNVSVAMLCKLATAYDMKVIQMLEGVSGLDAPAMTLQTFRSKVEQEKEHQLTKWGSDNTAHDSYEWFMILSEEVGEVARSVLEGNDYIGELVQLVAVIEQWATSYPTIEDVE